MGCGRYTQCPRRDGRVSAVGPAQSGSGRGGYQHPFAATAWA